MGARFEKTALFFLGALLPTQLTLHFWPEWSLIRGVRVDYLSPALYLTDFLVIFLMILSRRWYRVSRYAVFFVVSNVLFSLSPLVTAYKWIRIYEYYWLYKYIAGIDYSVFKVYLSRGLKIAIVWTAGLAWTQFLLQRSAGGWWYWLGERTFRLSTPLIAKIDLGGHLWLRSYATFPHPNALAGWLLITGYLSMGWYKLLAWLTIPITFSRSALMALPIFLWFMSKRLALILAAGLILMSTHVGSSVSWSERKALIYSSLQTIKLHPLVGVGLGNFVQTVPDVRQPVHNIYLLLAAELGIPAATVVAAGLIWRLLKTKNQKAKIVLLSVLLIGLVDHYWLTLHQNLLLLAVLLAVIKKSNAENIL